MLRRLILASAAAALALTLAPVLPQHATLGVTAAQAADMKVTVRKSKRVKKSAARPAGSQGTAKGMQLQPNPAGSRFPYSWRY
jgi:hypothetical protein